MSDRLRCLVPFCRCTRRRGAGDMASTEWICAKHWRPVPRAVKDERTVAARRCRRTMALDRAYPRIEAAFRSAWQACRAAAIEAAGGIG